MNIKEKAKGFVLEKAMSYVSGNPEENLPKLLSWADGFDKEDNWKSQRDVFRGIVNDPENNWYQYVMNLYRDIDNEVLQMTFRNFLINAGMIGYPKQRKMEEKLDCNVPWAILMDPTSTCNLQCTGCWGRRVR